MQTHYIEQLKELFSSCKFETYTYTTELHMARVLGRQHGYKYIMYGAGNNARAVANYVVRNQGIHIEYIVDKKPQKEEIEGIPVVSCKAFSEINKRQNNKWCALVSIGEYGFGDEVTEDIDRYLYSEGVVKIVKMDSQVAQITKTDWYDFFISNQTAFLQGGEILADELSRETLYEFIRAYLEGHSYEGKTSPEEDKYFLFDEDKIEHFEDEEWINFGAYNGDTIYHFLGHECSFKQIYAVEGDVDTSKILEKNISLLPNELKKKISIINQYFGGKGNPALDESFMDKRITYINMDIEGAEREVLSSAENVIKRNRPVLAICVYHKKDDLITCLDLICEIVDDYSFFLRKYPSLVGAYYDGYFQLNELVLYAVPNERVKK